MKNTWKTPGDHPGSWYEIRAEFDALLTDTQVYQAAGCIGYALRQTLHGESLSEPEKAKRTGDGRTIVRFSYDSTKSQSDDPDDQSAFEIAGQYVREGSPLRTTNRAGANTAGTRLCEGLGANISAKFWVR
ncbi:hypothetical protein [Armatimonas sp.]|uniref:hypothetical protein n=1 Tax=Armatimonas sp. TaxID=1872638 RepID=UPI00374DED63